MNLTRVMLLALLLIPACTGGSTPGLFFNFTGQWESEEFTLVEDRCTGTTLIQSPATGPAFAYSVEQVGQNITVRDDAGVLTGEDRRTGFFVSDESGSDGDPVDTALLIPELFALNPECVATSTLSYEGETETSGQLTLEVTIICVDPETGIALNRCTLTYTATTQRLSDTL